MTREKCPTCASYVEVAKGDEGTSYFVPIEENINKMKADAVREFMEEIISDLFMARWSGSVVLSNVDNMKEQLNKTLIDQLAGYWSGHTAYNIAVDGGFLLDEGKSEGKKLTPLGVLFTKDYAKQLEQTKT